VGAERRLDHRVDVVAGQLRHVRVRHDDVAVHDLLAGHDHAARGLRHLDVGPGGVVPLGVALGVGPQCVHDRDVRLQRADGGQLLARERARRRRVDVRVVTRDVGAERTAVGQERHAPPLRLQPDQQAEARVLGERQGPGLDALAHVRGKAERLQRDHGEGQPAQDAGGDQQLHVDRADDGDGVDAAAAGTDQFADGGHRVVGEPAAAESHRLAVVDQFAEGLQRDDLVPRRTAGGRGAHASTCTFLRM
jgi:hypothetical protein